MRRRELVRACELWRSYHQVFQGRLELRQHVRAGSGDGDHVAMAYAAESFDIDGRLDIEDHAALQHVGRIARDPRPRAMVDCREPDTVSGGMAELLPESALHHDPARRPIHVPGWNPRAD